MRYHYALQKYRGRQTRYTCPSCRRSGEFVRYIDTQTREHLANHVGRCNREVNCGYHYTPKQYFVDSQISSKGNGHHPKRLERPLVIIPEPISTISIERFYESLTKYKENYFVLYLRRLFGADITSELIKRFHIGTSNYWRGATVFWQIDVRGRIRSGKIMLYESATGKRVKEVKADGSKQSKITWAHSVLQKQGVVKDFNLRQCLFGEHQLLGQSKARPVAIVESEKTAIIASAYLPDFIWLACGSLTNLTDNRCRVLIGRKVVLFPDLKGFEKWSNQAKYLKALLDCSIKVSDLLENKASQSDRAQGFDIADYLVKCQPVINDLPDEIYIPAGMTNTVEAITRGIEMQRTSKAA